VRSKAPFLALILLCTALAGAFAGPEDILRAKSLSRGYDFRENSEIRSLLASVIAADPFALTRLTSKVYEQESEDHRVLVRTAEQRGAVYILFLNEHTYQFPVYGEGSYIIKKDGSTGEYVQIKIFLRSDEGSFLRVRPHPQGVRLDLYLYGKPFYLDIPVPLSFEELLTEPFSTLVGRSRKKIRWDLVFAAGNPEVDRFALRIVENLRDKLPLLGDVEDGAMDDTGRFVYIETLKPQPQVAEGFNCSGFAKWVVDGFYTPMTGRMSGIEEAKRRMSNRGNRWSDRYEYERDPYFGLDWTRNLALLLGNAARTTGNLETEDVDVRDVPFFGYVPDMGYEMTDLEPLLFLLAQIEPGHFYLGSVNDVMDEDPYLRQHFHVAVFFPYFDARGRFHVTVFERNVESPFEAFVEGNEGRMIHLVRLPLLRRFDPPRVE
jgi:hypothetical protein